MADINLSSLFSVKYVFLFLVGLFSSSFGTLAGGGGLLTIPVLMLLGLPPDMAIATNRFSVNGLIIAGLYEFTKKGMVSYKIGLTIALPALIGSFFGSMLVLRIDDDVLTYTIAAVTILVLIIMVLKPNIGVVGRNISIGKTHYAMGMLVSFFIGVQSGFYGPATGIFLSYLLVLLFGQTFIESAATRKVVTLFSSLLATAVFIVAKAVVYPMGIVLFLGNLTGSWLGSHYSERIGNIWVKRLFIGVVICMVLKLVI